MNKTISSLVLVLVSMIVYGQDDLEKRLTRNVIDCDDIALNSSELFIDYLKSDQLDSASIVLDFWERSCDLREPILRAKILLTILSSELSEEVYDSSILERIDNFITRMELAESENNREAYEYYAPYFGYVPMDSGFDRATKEIAHGVDHFDNDLEKLYCLLYSGRIDDFYRLLQEPGFEDYVVRQVYDKEVGELKRLPDTHFDISLGTFIPRSNASLLGVHPTLGLSGGVKVKRFTYDLTMDMRFGSTKNKYQVIKSDTITTDYFFGAYIGIDVSYDIFRYKKSELLALGGFGLDGFDTEFTVSNGEAAVSVFSPNLNGGLMYRWYYNSKNYIGLSYTYNLVDYNSDKIVNDLSGNFHAISISFGGVTNKQKREGLERLRYQK